MPSQPTAILEAGDPQRGSERDSKPNIDSIGSLASLKQFSKDIDPRASSIWKRTDADSKYKGNN